MLEANNIIIINEHTKEVYAMIKKTDEVITKDGVAVVLDYGTRDNIYTGENGRLYYKGE